MRKMVREALEPIISKCHKENMSYFSKDLEVPNFKELGRGAAKPQNQQMS